MRICREGCALVAIICLWLFAVLQVTATMPSTQDFVFPPRQNTFERLLLVASTGLLLGFTIFTGVKKLKCIEEIDAVQNYSRSSGRRRVVLATLMITMIFLPAAYGYVFHQGDQTASQMVLNSEILMQEDFDDLTPPQIPTNWTQMNGNWTTCYDNGNVVYQQDDDSDHRALTITASGNETWANFTYQVRLKFIIGNDKKPDAGALILFRYMNANQYYYLRLEQYADMMRLYRQGGEGIGLERGSVSIVLAEGTWYNVTISIVGQIANVWVDNVQYLSDVDMQGPIISGSVGVGTRYYRCYFDDILVTET